MRAICLVVLVPFNCIPKTFLSRRFRLESEFFFSFACIKHPSRLTVGLRSVPVYLPGEASQTSYDFRQFTNSNLVSCPQIHGLGFVVEFCCKENPFGSVIDIKELSGSVPCAPKSYYLCAGFDGLKELSDHSWNDVRGFKVKIVPWTIQIDR